MDHGHRDATAAQRRGNAYACYLVVGTEVDPRTLSDASGLTPTRSWRKGEPIGPGSDALRSAGLWSVHKYAPSVDEAIGRLLEVLGPKLEEITRHVETVGARTEVELYLEASPTCSRHEVDSRLLCQLSELGGVVRILLVDE